MKDQTHDEAMAVLFREDPGCAPELLNSILEGGHRGELLIALRQMTTAFGGVAKVAGQARLNGTHLGRALSARGTPEIRSLSAILRTMGLHLAAHPIQPPEAHA